MHRLHQTLTLTFIALILAACGGSESSSTSSPTQSNSSNTVQQKALSNMGTNVKQPFNGYEIQVLSDKTLANDQETSQSTIAVYGSVNGVATNSLLKINSNYKGSTITVNVYKGDHIVGTSKHITLNEQVAVNFGNITTNL